VTGIPVYARTGVPGTVATIEVGRPAHTQRRRGRAHARRRSQSAPDPNDGLPEDDELDVDDGMEVGRILPKFVTPSDVRDLKNRVDPFVRALDQGVTDCKGLPDGVRAGWQAFSKAWRSYFDEEDSWWHTAAQMDQGEAYEQDLAKWQTMIAGYKCATDAPPVTPDDEGGGADASRWQGTIKTVAIAGALVAVVLGIRTVMK
jgi:hypothetical protein